MLINWSLFCLSYCFFIVFIVDAEVDALSHLLFVLAVQFAIELFDEEDNVVDFVLFQTFEFGDEIGSSVFVEVESALVEFVDGWVVGFGV